MLNANRLQPFYPDQQLTNAEDLQNYHLALTAFLVNYINVKEQSERPTLQAIRLIPLSQVCQYVV